MFISCHRDGCYLYVGNASPHNTDTVSALALQDALATTLCGCGCCDAVGPTVQILSSASYSFQLPIILRQYYDLL